MRKRWMVLVVVMLGGAVAGCARQEVPLVAESLDSEEVRAIKVMLQNSGNRWMGEDLETEKLEDVGDGVYRVGRWTLDLSEGTFTFEHVNRHVAPPIFFGVSGVLERDAGGKMVARVTKWGTRSQ